MVFIMNNFKLLKFICYRFSRTSYKGVFCSLSCARYKGLTIFCSCINCLYLVFYIKSLLTVFNILHLIPTYLVHVVLRRLRDFCFLYVTLNEQQQPFCLSHWSTHLPQAPGMGMANGKYWCLWRKTLMINKSVHFVNVWVSSIDR